MAHKRDAGRWPNDAKRPLTPDGEERFRHAAGSLLQLVPEVGVVLTSPFTRAWRTAEILEQAGWATPVPREELEPDYPPHKILDTLACYADVGSVALVGHRPQLHELASYLLTGNAEGARVQIKKGGAARFSFHDLPKPGAGYLEWLLTPRVLRTIG